MKEYDDLEISAIRVFYPEILKESTALVSPKIRIMKVRRRKTGRQEYEFMCLAPTDNVTDERLTFYDYLSGMHVFGALYLSIDHVKALHAHLAKLIATDSESPEKSVCVSLVNLTYHQKRFLNKLRRWIGDGSELTLRSICKKVRYSYDSVGVWLGDFESRGILTSRIVHKEKVVAFTPEFIESELRRSSGFRK